MSKSTWDRLKPVEWINPDAFRHEGATKPPDWVDPEGFLFCGADPSWTPAKESVNSAPPPPGECWHCKSRGDYAYDSEGNIRRDDFGDPVFLRGAIEDGSHAVCPTCRRYGLERLLDRTPLSVMMRERDAASGVGDEAGEGESRRVDSSTGKLDLSDLVVSVQPVAEPGFVMKSVAAGSVSVPERWAHLLDGH